MSDDALDSLDVSRISMVIVRSSSPGSLKLNVEVRSLKHSQGAAIVRAVYSPFASRSALRNTKGSGATASAQQAAVTNGSAPGATEPLQLSSNILLESSGDTILAAALVDVSRPRLRARASLPADERATRVAVAVSATAAPTRVVR